MNEETITRTVAILAIVIASALLIVLLIAC